MLLDDPDPPPRSFRPTHHRLAEVDLFGWGLTERALPRGRPTAKHAALGALPSDLAVERLEEQEDVDLLHVEGVDRRIEARHREAARTESIDDLVGEPPRVFDLGLTHGFDRAAQDLLLGGVDRDPLDVDHLLGDRRGQLATQLAEDRDVARENDVIDFVGVDDLPQPIHDLARVLLNVLLDTGLIAKLGPTGDAGAVDGLGGEKVFLRQDFTQAAYEETSLGRVGHAYGIERRLVGELDERVEMRHRADDESVVIEFGAEGMGFP